MDQVEHQKNRKNQKKKEKLMDQVEHQKNRRNQKKKRK